MLRASSLASGSGAYLVQVVCHTRGRLDPAALTEALRLLIRERPALSHRLHAAESATPTLGPAPPALPLIGFEDGEADEERFEQLLRQDRDAGFDFVQDPPWRARAVRRDCETWSLIFTYHHVLLDGRSHTLILRDWLDAYDALRENREVQIPASSGGIHRPDQDTPEARRYWESELSGLGAGAPFLREFAATPRLPNEPSMAKRGFELDAEESRRLSAFAEKIEVAPSTLLVAAWGLVLGRWERLQRRRHGSRQGLPRTRVDRRWNADQHRPFQCSSARGRAGRDVAPRFAVGDGKPCGSMKTPRRSWFINRLHWRRALRSSTRWSCSTTSASATRFVVSAAPGRQEALKSGNGPTNRSP